MSQHRLVFAGAVLACALAVVGLYRAQQRPAEPSGGEFNPSTAETSAANAQVAADPARLRAVLDEVDRRNRETSDDRAAFENAGWRLVEAPQPDRDIKPRPSTANDDGHPR